MSELDSFDGQNSAFEDGQQVEMTPFQMVGDIVYTLGLDTIDVVEMFGPETTDEDIQEAHDALERMRSTFDHERLSRLVRRPSALFNGSTGLDWIIAGKIKEVAEDYDLIWNKAIAITQEYIDSRYPIEENPTDQS